jgi:hypothetical protein
MIISCQLNLQLHILHSSVLEMIELVDARGELTQDNLEEKCSNPLVSRGKLNVKC